MLTTFQFGCTAASNLPATEQRRSRRAFTLIELLIVISILAILASIMLFALAGAEGSAKVMRTQSTIMKIHNLVMQKYDQYRTRRITVDPKVVAYNLGYFAAMPSRPVDAVALARLNALRETMLLEMPDDFSDIGLKSGNNITARPLKFLSSWPSASRNYLLTLQRAQQLAIAKGKDIYSENINEECLYLFVTRGVDEPDALAQFSANEIADTDGDGLPEFIDAWNKPIKWLRWAPAFRSPLQPSSGTTPPGYDSFDPTNVDERLTAAMMPTPPGRPFDTFPLFPLIYSAGPDRYFDIDSNGGSSYASVDNNPFANGVATFVGRQFDIEDLGTDNTIDNITNHDLSGP